MLTKHVFFFGLLAGLLVIGGCKKTCTFPERQEGKVCWEIRNDLLGNYTGLAGTTYDGKPQTSYQNLQYEVKSWTLDMTGIVVSGIKGKFNDSLHLSFEPQVMLSNKLHYEVEGSGYFTDTVLYGKPNKGLVLNLHYEVLDDTVGTPGPGSFTLNFSGLR